MGGTIIRDPETGRFRLWSFVEYPGKPALPGYGLYYESKDGLNWERPNLGIVSWEGSTDNNLF